MGKGDVTLKFDANTAAFVQAITAARDKLEAGAESARKFGDHATKAGDKAESGFKKAGETAKHLAISVTGIGSAAQLAEKGVEILSRSFETYVERMRLRAEALLGKILNINTALGASGQETQAPAVRAALANIKFAGGKLVNPEEASRAFGAISRAVGNKVSAADKIEATKTALTGRAAQLDEAGSQELGVNFAQLARERRARGAFENYSNEQLQDLAYKVTINKPGGLSEKDMRFFSRARDKNQALDLLFAAAQSDESSKGLISLQNASEEEIDPARVKELEKEKHHHPTKFAADAEKVRTLRLSSVPQADRLEAMLYDPTLAPASDRLPIRSLQEGMKRLPQARGLYAELQAQGQSADEETRLADRNREADAMAARVKEDGAKQRLRHEATLKLSRAIWEQDNPILSSVPTTWWVPHAIAYLSGADEMPDAPNGASQPTTPAMPTTRPSPTTQPVHAELKTQTDLMRQQVEHMKDLAKRQEEQTSTMRGRRDTTLSNNGNLPGAQ